MIECLGPLQPGDRVALLSVSGSPSTTGMARGARLLRSWGLEPVAYPSTTATHPSASYLAGPDQLRADDLMAAWCDPGIAAVFCVRGGYGSVRVLDLLDAERMRQAAPKPLYGSSDVTALHEWLGAHLGVCSWHAPMVATGDLLNDPTATEYLRAAVLEGWHGRVYRGPGAETLVPGTATGRLVGGNLSLLALTLGARRNQPLDQGGTIVLLEDVTEDSYRIDGYLQSLLRAGWFDGVRGIARGSWRSCDLDQVKSLVAELLAPLGVPIVWELGFGHGPASFSVPLGVSARLDAGSSPSLTVL